MLEVALKEWAVVCDLLLEGHLALLLRKGGIHESGGAGKFEVRYTRFALYPSWEHQRPAMLKPAYQPRVAVLEEPARITFKGFGEVAKIWRVPDRGTFDLFDDLHCWASAQIDMRFNYKPDRPLYLVAVRAFLLREPKTVSNLRQYGGCRSWVPLRSEDAIDESGATPVLDEATFSAITSRVEQAFERPAIDSLEN